MGGQAQLLQRHRVGRAGRERRPLPLQGPPRGDRRTPGVARVGGPGRRKTPGNRYHCRLGAVPGLARGRLRRRRLRRQRGLQGQRRPGRRRGFPARTGRRRQPATTTFRSSQHSEVFLFSTASMSLQRAAPRRRAADGQGTRSRQAGAPARQEGRPRQRAAQAVPALPRQGRPGRLQGRHLAAQVHLREGQDPLAADHRLLPPPPGPDRARGQARARAGAAALRQRGRPRGRPPPRPRRPRRPER